MQILVGSLLGFEDINLSVLHEFIQDFGLRDAKLTLVYAFKRLSERFY